MTPVGSTVEKLKNGPCTLFWLPSRLCSLSHRPACHTSRAMAASSSRCAWADVAPPRRSSSTMPARRDSSISAMR